jgi:hypothetical protein
LSRREITAVLAMTLLAVVLWAVVAGFGATSSPRGDYPAPGVAPALAGTNR